MRYIEFENKKYSYRGFLESIDFNDNSTLSKLEEINKDLKERNRSYSDIHILKEFIKICTRDVEFDLSEDEDREVINLIFNYLKYPTPEFTDCLWCIRSLILKNYDRNFKNTYEVWIGNKDAYKITKEALGKSISTLKEFFIEKIQELDLKERYKSEIEDKFLDIDEERFFEIIYSSLGLRINKCNGEREINLSLGGIISDIENNYERILNHIKSTLIVKDIVFLASLIGHVSIDFKLRMRDGFIDRILTHEILEIIQSIPNKSFKDDDLQFYRTILHSIEPILNGVCTIYRCNSFSLDICSILLVKLNIDDSKLIEGLYKISLRRIFTSGDMEKISILTTEDLLLPKNKDRYKIRKISNISGLEDMVKYIALQSSSNRLLRESLSSFDKSQITEYLSEDYKNLEIQYSQSVIDHNPFIVNLFDSNRTKKCQKISKNTLQLISKALKDALEIGDYVTHCEYDSKGNKILCISNCNSKLFGLLQLVDEMFPSLLIEVINEIRDYSISDWDFSSGLIKISKD